MAGGDRSVAHRSVGVTGHVSSLSLIAEACESLCAWIPKVELTFTVTSINDQVEYMT
jgi:hypothetical protein